MKGLFNSLATSAKEFKQIRTLTLTAMLVCLSMLI